MSNNQLKQAQRAAPNLPELILLCEALTIFSETFNKRSDHDLYFSEKLLTPKQKNDYEKACEKLRNLKNNQ